MYFINISNFKFRLKDIKKEKKYHFYIFIDRIFFFISLKIEGIKILNLIYWWIK
jgi:hypothetical protein